MRGQDREKNAPRAFHRAGLPDCYYDRYRKKVIIRLISSEDVVSAGILHGDPYAYTKTGPSFRWIHGEAPMEKRYSSAGSRVWRAELELPRWNRLKYAFRLETPGASWYFSERGLVPFTPAEAFRDYHFFLFPYIHEADSPDMPPWAQNTVWYQIFPERFRRGNPAISPPNTADWDRGIPEYANFFGGDLAGIRQKLEYLRDLGINGLYLTPIFKAPSNHKYDTQDYYSIDEHFGDLGELKLLVKEAHARGIRVLLDAVFNHAGALHPFWQDVLLKQEQSEYKDYFHIRGFPVRERYEDPKNMNFDAFSFSAKMPKWNTENPGAREYLLGAAEYWVKECDIDGWRLDVANEVSLNFWEAFKKRVRAIKGDLYIVGEMWYDASPWLNSRLFDAVMNYPLGFLVADFFLHRKMPAGEFTEKLFSLLSRYSDSHNRVSFNLIDSHDMPRALSSAKGDKLALRNAFTMLFLLPGSPCIYYGTEVGMTGEGDPLCRGPMVWDEKKQDRELWSFFKELIALRRGHTDLIAQGLMDYEHSGGLDRWVLKGEGGTLLAAYAGDKPAPGPGASCLFSTGPVVNNVIPPFTMAVYYAPPPDKP